MSHTATLIDFHCHLDLYPDFESMVQACEAQRVRTLTVTTTPRAWPRNLALTEPTRYVRAALGLHPQLVAERAGELNLLEKYSPQARYIGEVGLDGGPAHYQSLPLQERVFTRILEISREQTDKILSVHSVRTVTRVLALVEKHLPPPCGQVVLHWFTGTKAEARRAIELGCYFSVNARMLAKPKGRNLVASLPTNRLLTETDGPFVLKGKYPAQPSDVMDVVCELSVLHKRSADQMLAQLDSNLRCLLRNEKAVS